MGKERIEKCACGEIMELVIEHDNNCLGLRIRLTCPCGICGPWENSWDHCYSSWSHLVACEEIDLLRKAARLIHDRRNMVSGSLEMAECDGICKSAGLEVWMWPLTKPEPLKPTENNAKGKA